MYYAVELDLYKKGKKYIELDKPVAYYREAIQQAEEIAERDGLLDDGDEIRCESEVFERRDN